MPQSSCLRTKKVDSWILTDYTHAHNFMIASSDLEGGASNTQCSARTVWIVHSKYKGSVKSNSYLNSMA